MKKQTMFVSLSFLCTVRGCNYTTDYSCLTPMGEKQQNIKDNNDKKPI